MVRWTSVFFLERPAGRGDALIILNPRCEYCGYSPLHEMSRDSYFVTVTICMSEPQTVSCLTNLPFFSSWVVVDLEGYAIGFVHSDI